MVLLASILKRATSYLLKVMIDFVPNRDINTALNFHLKNYNGLDVNSLGVDEYNKSYLSKYIEKLEYNTYLALDLVDKIDPIEVSLVVDYGCGIGFNGAMFRALGFKNVICMDIDPISVRDAKTINAALGIKNIEYIVGDYIKLGKLNLDKAFVCSRDVIEHIYSLPQFLEYTKKASYNRHNTAAIKNSYLRRNEFKKIHHRLEYLGSSATLLKNTDINQSYLSARKQIIKSFIPKIDETTLDQLGKETRGLIKADIEKYINLAELPKHHKAMLYSNTCNPINGNWAERVLKIADYKTLGLDAGLSIDYALPEYNTFNGGMVKKAGLKLLNFLVRVFKSERLAPSFTIKY